MKKFRIRIVFFLLLFLAAAIPSLVYLLYDSEDKIMETTIQNMAYEDTFTLHRSNYPSLWESFQNKKTTIRLGESYYCVMEYDHVNYPHEFLMTPYSYFNVNFDYFLVATLFQDSIVIKKMDSEKD